jgi:hypothetical protein
MKGISVGQRRIRVEKCIHCPFNRIAPSSFGRRYECWLDDEVVPTQSGTPPLCPLKVEVVTVVFTGA